jgi:nucleotide-binding universal stress UspA family protein
VNVLLAIDGSPCSEAAVKELAAMPWPAGTRVRVLSAAFVPRPTAPDPLHIVDPMRRELTEQERSRLGDLVASTAAWLRDNASASGLHVDPAVVEGEPEGAIIEEAERWGADLIMVGCHGHGAIKRFLLGSVSLAMTAHAPCSVHIVRRQH